jgi:hypothetical protein
MWCTLWRLEAWLHGAARPPVCRMRRETSCSTYVQAKAGCADPQVGHTCCRPSFCTSPNNHTWWQSGVGLAGCSWGMRRLLVSP